MNIGEYVLSQTEVGKEVLPRILGMSTDGRYLLVEECTIGNYLGDAIWSETVAAELADTLNMDDLHDKNVGWTKFDRRPVVIDAGYTSWDYLAGSEEAFYAFCEAAGIDYDESKMYLGSHYNENYEEEEYDEDDNDDTLETVHGSNWGDDPVAPVCQP